MKLNKFKVEKGSESHSGIKEPMTKAVTKKKNVIVAD